MNELDDESSICESLRELALFAGAGGGILGGKLLGWRTVCAVERDAYAAQVLAQRQNDGVLEPFPIWSDVQTFDGTRWRGLVDVVSGGFPCQDISCAGKGAGITGARSGMWAHMARIIGEVRPRYAFIENSPMLVTRGLDTVLSDLAAMGYDAEWGCISAADCGAPHERERIWIVAYSASNGSGRTIRELYKTDAIQPKSKKQYENKAEQFNDGCKNANSKQRDIFSHAEHNGDGWREEVLIAEGLRNRGIKKFPTPTAHNAKEQNSPSESERNSPTLASVAGGKLNPNWVEKLMGWPEDWTSIKPISHVSIIFWFMGFCDDESRKVTETLRMLREGNATQEIRETIGGFISIQESAVLLAKLCEYANRPDEARIFMASAETLESEMRVLRLSQGVTGAPHRPKHKKQSARQHTDTMQTLSRFLAHYGEKAWKDSSWEDAVPRVASGVTARTERLKSIGNGQVSRVAATAFAILRERLES
jgi:DNA (cytosine-5)-methyltransferase 1